MNTVTFGDLDVELKADDISILESKEWLNEALVNFFMCKRARDSRTEYDIHVNSTRWITTLMEPRSIAYIATLPDYINEALQLNYLGTQQIHQSLLHNDVLFVPVHLHENHWILFVVVLKSGAGDVRPRYGWLLCFDSRPRETAFAEYDKVANAIRGYLDCEWYFHNVLEKGKEERIYDVNSMPMKVMRMTRQRNTHDCGLYVIRACEAFIGEIARIVPRMNSDSVDWLNVLLRGKLSLGREFRKKLREEIGINGGSDDVSDSDSSSIEMF